MAEDLRVLEALLFASAEPVTERAIAERLGEKADVPALLEDLKRYYAGRGVELLQANDRWSFRTAPDVTERLRTEERLRQSERRFRETLEKVQIIAVELDLEGRIAFCNALRAPSRAISSTERKTAAELARAS